MSKKSKKAQVWIGFHEKGKEPEVLIFRTLSSRGGGWHPVTGGVDPEETFLEGAQREVLEETGIRKSFGKWIDLEFEYDFHGRWGHATEQAFGLILKGDRVDPILDPKEHLEFRWVTISKAREMLHYEDQRSALEKFSCYFK